MAPQCPAGRAAAKSSLYNFQNELTAFQRACLKVRSKKTPTWGAKPNKGVTLPWMASPAIRSSGRLAFWTRSLTFHGDRGGPIAGRGIGGFGRASGDRWSGGISFTPMFVLGSRDMGGPSRRQAKISPLLVTENLSLCAGLPTATGSLPGFVVPTRSDVFLGKTEIGVPDVLCADLANRFGRALWLCE